MKSYIVLLLCLWFGVRCKSFKTLDSCHGFWNPSSVLQLDGSFLRGTIQTLLKTWPVCCNSNDPFEIYSSRSTRSSFLREMFSYSYWLQIIILKPYFSEQHKWKEKREDTTKVHNNIQLERTISSISASTMETENNPC